MQVAYGDLDPVRLIEWFELQRLLGVQLIGVYVGGPSVSQRAIDVFRWYADDGLVELRYSDYIGPAGGDEVDRSWINITNQYLLHGSPVINDCIYRHMHSFRYIGVYDFDEVSVSRCD